MRLGLALAFVGAASCSGEIADGTATPPPRDEARPAEAAAPAPSSSPGAPGAAAPPSECAFRPSSDLRRLSAREYVASVQDLLGVALTDAGLPADPLDAANFDNDPSMLHVNGLDAGLYYDYLDQATSRAYAAGKSRLADGLPRFLRRAFGATPAPDVVAKYQAIVASEADPLAGEIKAVMAALMSPRFLYTWAGGVDAPGVVLLQRLMLMLWGSRVPDEDALAAAERGDLAAPAKLRDLVHRMLQDPRANRFVSGFFSQWLAITRLHLQTLDRKLYPEFTPELASSMRQETELFVREVLAKNLGVSQLFDATFSTVNPLLAGLYGLPAGTVGGSGFARAALPARQRRGLMTQASVLTTTNSKDSTSPVRRSLYYLRTFECLDIPPPPADVDVDGLASANPPPAGATVKQGLMHHRSLGQVCSGCHSLIDPLGLAFEPYSSDGKWRDSYPGTNQRVESDWDYQGQAFDGPIDLIDNVLRRQKREEPCLARHMIEYATGSLMPADETCSARLVAAIPPGEATLERIVFEIARMDAMSALRREAQP
jgi:hypothetical protein